ncbi:MAG: hypothetical protein HQK76_14895 [Desulfobacterales bacterium]|nr:hypothetical protein [Desulfobacterales bacterium]
MKIADIFKSNGYKKASNGQVDDIIIYVQVCSVNVKGILHCNDAYDMSVSLIEPEHLQSTSTCGHVPYFAKGNLALIKVDSEGNFTERAINEGKEVLTELYKRELLVYNNKSELFIELEKCYHSSSEKKVRNMRLERIIENFMKENGISLIGLAFYAQDIIYKFLKEHHPEEL